jgi:hypothetical protein
MAKRKLPSVAEPATRGSSAETAARDYDFAGRPPDVVRLDPLISSNPPVRPGYLVQTGVNVLTREPIFKEIDPVVEYQWDTPDRRPYLATTTINGSYNQRVLNLKQGVVIYLNEKEHRVFSPYVQEIAGDYQGIQALEKK